MDHERDNLFEVKTRIPERTLLYINQLVDRGYFSSAADFARQAILDKLIDDFELGISELEPDILEQLEKQNTAKPKKRTGVGILAQR